LHRRIHDPSVVAVEGCREVFRELRPLRDTVHRPKEYITDVGCRRDRWGRKVEHRYRFGIQSVEGGVDSGKKCSWTSEVEDSVGLEGVKRAV
jgi:hypothetical protein